jgi:hypothetical protein
MASANDATRREARYREAYRLMRETSVEPPLPWERLHEQERNWFRAYADAYAAVIDIEKVSE